METLSWKHPLWHLWDVLYSQAAVLLDQRAKISAKPHCSPSENKSNNKNLSEVKPRITITTLRRLSPLDRKHGFKCPRNMKSLKFILQIKPLSPYGQVILFLVNQPSSLGLNKAWGLKHWEMLNYMMRWKHNKNFTFVHTETDGYSMIWRNCQCCMELRPSRIAVGRASYLGAADPGSLPGRDIPKNLKKGNCHFLAWQSALTGPSIMVRVGRRSCLL